MIGADCFGQWLGRSWQAGCHGLWQSAAVCGEQLAALTHEEGQGCGEVMFWVGTAVCIDTQRHRLAALEQDWEANGVHQCSEGRVSEQRQAAEDWSGKLLPRQVTYYFPPTNSLGIN